MNLNQFQPLTCGDDLIGYVQVTDGDHYWLLGKFRPGRDWLRYRQLFVEMAYVYERLDEDLEREEYLRVSEAWNEALERINDLPLKLGDRDLQDKDFKIDRDFEVEFRLWD